VPSVRHPSKPVKLIVFGIALLIGLGLSYCDVRGLLSPGVGTLVSFGYITLVGGLLVITGVVPLPQRGLGALIGARLALFAKSGACLLACFIWTVLVVHFAPDNAVGATILLGPLAIMFVGFLWFLARGFGLF
jgi:hypothetical protein